MVEVVVIFELGWVVFCVVLVLVGLVVIFVVVLFVGVWFGLLLVVGFGIGIMFEGLCFGFVGLWCVMILWCDLGGLLV